MKISDITSQILKSSKKAQELDKKFIDGLVKEQLILRDYYKTFGKLNEEEEDEEVELEPEDITVPEEEDDFEPEAQVADNEEEVELDPEDIEVEDDPESDFIPDEEPEAEIDSETAIGTKEPEGDGYIRISPTEAQELLSYKGKIFQAVFTKKNGELRAMNGMTGVRKYTSGGELPYSPKEAGVIPVYDLKIGMGPKGYRMINIAGLKTLHINGKKFKIDQTLKEIKVNNPGINKQDILKLIHSRFIGKSPQPIRKVFEKYGLEWNTHKGIENFMDQNPNKLHKIYKDLKALSNLNEIKVNKPTKKLFQFIIQDGDDEGMLFLLDKTGYPYKMIDGRAYYNNNGGISFRTSQNIPDINNIQKNIRGVYSIPKEIAKILNESNNMKKSELRQIVKEIVLETRGFEPQRQPEQPNRPLETPTIDPDVAPSRPPKRRTLTPPDDAPDTKPKAEGVEKDLANKMANRFQKLK
jgi:hypothetical protein